MTIKQFIEKAIEGGYALQSTGMDLAAKHTVQSFLANKEMFPDLLPLWIVNTILFDPLAWQAVGRVEGWDKIMPDDGYGGEFIENCHTKMHRMIDFIYEGKTVEEYLGTL